MPRINQSWLDSTIYLYPTEDAARRGEQCGGTGFLVGYVPEYGIRRYPHVYAVTNHHVAVSGNSPVVRVNNLDGGQEIFAFDSHDWEFVPRGDDVAVIRLPVDIKRHKFTCISSAMFVTEKKLQAEKIGVGDDIFMMGRFMDHDGGTTNQPAARFGNISVMPTPIELENWQKRELYCIDLHSRSGYSGSPVVVYRTFGQDLTNSDVSDLVSGSVNGNRLHIKLKNFVGLLGIHVAQFPETFVGKTPKKSAKRRSRDIQIVGVSGMTIAIPAWRITEALELPKLEKERQQIDAADAAQHEREKEAMPRLEGVRVPLHPERPKPARKR